MKIIVDTWQNFIASGEIYGIPLSQQKRSDDLGGFLQLFCKNKCVGEINILASQRSHTGARGVTRGAIRGAIGVILIDHTYMPKKRSNGADRVNGATGANRANGTEHIYMPYICSIKRNIGRT